MALIQTIISARHWTFRLRQLLSARVQLRLFRGPGPCMWMRWREPFSGISEKSWAEGGSDVDNDIDHIERPTDLIILTTNRPYS